jgi:endonuclease/exonuclease/phosphatase family metal-dependent hydrolase
LDVARFGSESPRPSSAGRTRHRTFPGAWPILRLDRIYCRPEHALVRSWVEPAGAEVSDHLPVIADISL